MKFEIGAKVRHKNLDVAGEVIAVYGDAAKVRWALRRVRDSWLAMSALRSLDEVALKPDDGTK